MTWFFSIFGVEYNIQILHCYITNGIKGPQFKLQRTSYEDLYSTLHTFIYLDSFQLYASSWSRIYLFRTFLALTHQGWKLDIVLFQKFTAQGQSSTCFCHFWTIFVRQKICGDLSSILYQYTSYEIMLQNIVKSRYQSLLCIDFYWYYKFYDSIWDIRNHNLR